MTIHPSVHISNVWHKTWIHRLSDCWSRYPCLLAVLIHLFPWWLLLTPDTPWGLWSNESEKQICFNLACANASRASVSLTRRPFFPQMVDFVKDQMKKVSLSEPETVVIVWNTLMNAVEWNKKEELVADQSLKHLRQYATLLAAVSQSGKSQLQLMVKIQEYCYDNMNFMKVFQKIILLLYKGDSILSFTQIPSLPPWNPFPSCWWPCTWPRWLLRVLI